MPGTVLITDDMTLVREPIAAALLNAGYTALLAANGQEALQVVRSNHIDLILLDVMMPEMDGLEFLKHLRALPEGREVKVILLTANRGRETVIKAAGFGVRDYILKAHFSLKELLSRVDRLMTAPPAIDIAPQPPAAPNTPAVKSTEEKFSTKNAASSPAAAKSVPRSENTLTASKTVPGDQTKLVLLTRDQTRQRLEQITGTQTCAGIVSQVMSITNSPQANMGDLVHVIETDPVLASRVLQLANSAMFKQKHARLTNIDDAVRNVGMRAIQNMILSIGIFQTFPPDAADGFNTMHCWQHSFAAAAIVRTLMAHRNEEEREHIALVALCHDLGEIVLRHHFAAEYEQILRHATATEQTVSAVEATALSMRHGDLASDVLTRIGLPPNVAIPIMRFHDGGTAGAPDELQVVRLLQTANWLAHGMLLAASMEAAVSPVLKADLKRACGTDQTAVDVPTMRAEVLTATNTLARLPASDEARFLKPLHTRSTTRIWYARHSSYAPLDPLAAALEMLGHARIEQRLPSQPGELEESDLVVVAAPFPDSGPAMINEMRSLQKTPAYRKQPFMLLLGNPTGIAKVSNLTAFKLPISLAVLAEAIEAAAPEPVAVA